ncbi:dUTP diphosphatase [Bacillus sp. JAS24-2]|uniref:dUTP diphosphatase n=1 Tax=Bacillus sp. JAS24-2 TaxID=2217832 RepID=UPI0015D373D7|nr:dUTP diphosphatase [Bacillus sp. JAS24-2]
MNLQRLFDIQKNLDEFAANKPQVAPFEVFQHKILNLIIKISELTNEIQYLNNKKSNSKCLLKLYINGFQDILSVGIKLGAHSGFQFFKYKIRIEEYAHQLLDIYISIITLNKRPSITNYIDLFIRYIQLGQSLGFEQNKIEQAYLATFSN